jgi:hypothetical protein
MKKAKILLALGTRDIGFVLTAIFDQMVAKWAFPCIRVCLGDEKAMEFSVRLGSH